MAGIHNINQDYANIDDRIGRSTNVSQFGAFLSSLSAPTVIEVCGRYGIGKTTFLHMLQEQLQQRHNLPAILISAWDYDGFLPPMEVIGAGLAEASGEIGKEDSEEVMRSLLRIMKSGAQAGGRHLLTKVVGDDGADQVIGAVLDQTLDEALAASLGAIKEIREAKDSVTHHLEQLRNAWWKAEHGDKANDKDARLVVLIDELDRCRPTFAVDFLEAIRHYYNKVHGISFVITIDEEFVRSACSVRYGFAGVDADIYLRRFFDISIDLPALRGPSFVELLKERFHSAEFAEPKGHWDAELDLLHWLSSIFELTLRDLEQVFSKVSFLARSRFINPRLSLSPFLVLLCAKFSKLDALQAFTTPGNVDFNLSQHTNVDNFNEIEHDWVKKLFLAYASLFREQPSQLIKKIEEAQGRVSPHRRALGMIVRDLGLTGGSVGKALWDEMSSVVGMP